MHGSFLVLDISILNTVSYYKMKIQIFYLLLLLLCSSMCIAQDEYTAPSPAASALTKVGNSEVDLYSGKINIQIPIHTIKDRSATGPISLNYTGSGGIKVQEIAGCAGLGWVLNVGGVITRTVRGLLGDPAGTTAQRLNSDIYSSAFRDNFSESGRGQEPDIYNSSIGGRIIFDQNNVPRFMNNQGFVIEANGVTNADSTWVIIDQKGTKYVFGKQSVEREHTMGQLSPFDKFYYTSSWYLSEIRTIDGGIITFEYEKIGKIVYPYFQHVGRSVTGNHELATAYYYPDIVILDQVRIKRVKTRAQTVVFNYVGRLDLIGAGAISDITVYDNANDLLKKYKFETSYFSNQITTPELRLKLDNVKQYSADLTNSNLISEFYYNTSVNLPARTSPKYDHWGYFNNNLSESYLLPNADKASHLQNAQANILTGIKWPTGGKTSYTYELNTYRKGNQDMSGGGLRISSVTNSDVSTSLTTNYSYTNDLAYSSGILIYDFDLIKGYTTTYHFAGPPLGDYYETTDMPIAKLQDDSGISVGYSVVTIEHPDHSKEKHYFTDFHTYPDIIDYKYNSMGPVPAGFVSIDANASVSDFNGFTSVSSRSIKRGNLFKKEIYDDNARLIKRITNVYDFYDGVKTAGSQAKVYRVTTIKNGANTYSVNHYYRSLYYETEITKKLIEVTEEDFDPSTQSLLTEFKTKFKYKPYPKNFLIDVKEELMSDNSWLTTNYRYASDVNPPATYPHYVYGFITNANILQPIEVITSKVKNGNKYVLKSELNKFDLKFNQQSSDLFPVLKSHSYYVADYPVLSSSYNYFTAYLNFESSDPGMFQDVSYEYDLNRNLVSKKIADTSITSYLWDDDQHLLIAIGNNTAQSDMAYTSFEANETGNWTYSGTIVSSYFVTGKKSLSFGSSGSITKIGLDSEKQYRVLMWYRAGNGLPPGDGFVVVKNSGNHGWMLCEKKIIGQSSFSFSMPNCFIDEIRICPVESEMKTFTYNVLGGMTSMTDTKGATTYYDYDVFHRLLNVKDQNSHVVKSINYNYRYSPDWQDTGLKECVVDNTGWNAGEQRVQQQDKNPISTTFNQTRWKSPYYDVSCVPTMYAKLWFGNFGSRGAFYEGSLIVYFYQNQACTIPANVLPDVVVKVKNFKNGQYVTTRTFNCHGAVSNLGRFVQNGYLNGPPAGGSHLFDYYNTYSLDIGGNYIIVN